MSSKIENSLISELVDEILYKLILDDSETTLTVSHMLEASISRMQWSERVQFAKEHGILKANETQEIVNVLLEKFHRGENVIHNRLFSFIYSLSNIKQLELFSTYDISVAYVD
jgi:hypothetical protein